MDKKEIMSIIVDHCLRIGIPTDLGIAQAKQESSLDPRAKSHCGAIGLLQVMPATALEVDPSVDTEEELYDINTNLRVGFEYLRRQVDLFSACPTIEQWKFALGAYNGGAGYIRKAISIAKDDIAMGKDLTAPYVPVGLSNSARDQWMFWEFSSRRLADPRCVVRGRNPDEKQIWDYVSRIWKTMEFIQSKGGVGAFISGVEKFS